MHYVYVILNIDTCVPLYVGKGIGRRMNKHLQMCKAGKHYNKFLQATVAKAWANSERIFPVKLWEDLDEDQAFRIERLLIKLWGRKDSGGSLCNLTDGGDGLSTYWNETTRLEHSRRKRSDAENISTKMRKVWADRTEEERHSTTAKARAAITPEIREKSKRARKRAAELLDPEIHKAQVAFRTEKLREVDWAAVQEKVKATKSQWSDEKKAEYSRKMREAAAKRWGDKKCQE